MSHDPQQSPISASGSSNWTDPPWMGFIETTGDALLILEAARRGMIPRVTRRLVDSERKMITSGSVFVFDEDESGIKRWTDGFFWSPSRILGNFLLYRETEKRGAGHRSTRVEQPLEEVDPKGDGQSLSRPKSEAHRLTSVDRQRERSLVGSLTNSYKFKPGGMMKKTFSLTIGGVAQHLISYYKIEDVEKGRLRSPSSLPEIASLDISSEYLDKTHFRNPPKVEVGVDGVPRYRGEADDTESSPTLLPAPLSGMPLYPDSIDSSKRGKQRYGPYDGSTSNKRRKKSSASNASSSPVEPTSPSSSVTQPSPQAAITYPVSESSSAPTQPAPHYPAYGYYVPPGYHPPPVYPSASPYPTLPPPTTSSPHPPTPPSAQYAYQSYPPSEATAYSSYYAQPHAYAAYTPPSWPHYSYSAQAGAHAPASIEGGERVEEVEGGES
ncbi:Gti1/Pac2 family-domain-containing protein [Rhodofomes roseus]|uniref:Gti1/Pac2 family-domain-containing protein n=1 Tax=Rhodofomes roseus TaxID=34475 RepID=A0ABQ8KPQ7_9APHY|nr:Gti1/Pac2 family-domain-containing protein [Rhodofomes roseus]KAH9840589.1 Gti1/Pac2 family-domain-containing protein [Rhodofomes roseus]